MSFNLNTLFLVTKGLITSRNYRMIERTMYRSIVKFINFVKIIVMRFLGLGKRVQPKEFLYIPQYYDEKKERLDNMLSEADPNDEGGADAMKARIKHSLSYRPYYYDKNRTASQLRKKANIRTLIIAIILFGIILFILNHYSQDLSDFTK